MPMKRHLCSSYCDRNSTRHLHKIQKLKHKDDEESLKLLRDDPLVGIPVECRFSFPKRLSDSTKLKIVQKVIFINNVYRFTYSIEVLTK